MAISSTIDVSDPDGATKKVSYLDNAIRQHKVDVRERMEDSIIDTGVTGWLTTTSKELKEGLARVATGTRANEANFTTTFSPQILRDGKIYISTDADNSQAVDYYDGAAWVDLPIGTANLLTNAVTTAKITDANVTTDKIAVAAVTALRANLTNTTDDTVSSVTPTMIGTLSGTDFTVSFTPHSADSVIVCVLQCRPSLSGGGANRVGFFDILESVGLTVLATFRTQRQGLIGEATTEERSHMTMIGIQTGVTGARTYVARMYCENAADTLHLEGDVQVARFMVFEFLR